MLLRKTRSEKRKSAVLLAGVCLLLAQGCGSHSYANGDTKPPVASLKADPSKMTPEQKALYQRVMTQMQQKMQNVQGAPKTGSPH